MVEREPLWERCAACMTHFQMERALMLSFASVGIEHGKSSYQMAESYFRAYHRSGHTGRWGEPADG